MELRIVSERGAPREGFPVVEIAIEDGQLIVDTDDQSLLERVVQLLTKVHFEAGKGFPVFEKDPRTGQIVRDESNGSRLVARHVEMDDEPEVVLRAIRDCLSLDGMFEVIEAEGEA
jgi:hypothetical protein